MLLHWIPWGSCSERFMFRNIWNILAGYSINVNEKIVKKESLKNKARIGRTCYFKVPELCFEVPALHQRSTTYPSKYVFKCGFEQNLYISCVAQIFELQSCSKVSSSMYESAPLLWPSSALICILNTLTGIFSYLNIVALEILWLASVVCRNRLREQEWLHLPCHVL